MENQDIKNWLRQARANGLSDMQIQLFLKGAGWTNEQIDDVLRTDITPNKTFRDNRVYTPPASGGTLPSFFELLQSAWEALTAKAGQFTAVVAIYFGTELLVLLISTLLTGGAILYLTGDLASGNTDLSSIFSGLAVSFFAGIIIGLLFAAIILWAQAAIILVAGQDGPSGGKFKQAARLILPLAWIGILNSFFVGGASMLFVIPGLVLAVWFMFAPYIMVMENVRGWQALLRSKEYVRGYWWPVFWRLIGFGLISFIFFIAVGWAINYIPNQAIISIITIVVFSAYLPLSIIFSLLIYQSLRSLKGTLVNVPQKKGGLLTAAVIGWMAIPFIIMSIGGVAFGSSRLKARDAIRKSDISQLRTAIILYYDDNNKYPAALNDLTSIFKDGVPRDPDDKDYIFLSSGDTFTVCAEFEEIDRYTLHNKYCYDETGLVDFSNSDP